MEMRIPVMMVGAAAGRMTRNALRTGLTSSVRDVQPLSAYRHDAESGVDQHRPQGTDEDHEDRSSARNPDRVERERHPREGRDRLQHLDERIESFVHERRHADQEAQGDGHQRRQGEANQHPPDRYYASWMPMPWSLVPRT